MEHLPQVFLAGVACFVGVIAIISIIVMCCNCKPTSQTLPQTRPRTRSGRMSWSREDVGESASFDLSLQEVFMSELIAVTNDFDPKLIIGDGSFGLVYKAVLNNGVTVALKKLSHDAFQGLREFRAEMETLGKLQHRNIVKMLGYCVSGFERVLIYEFIEKGSLDQWLQDMASLPGEEEERWALSWELRVRIVKGVADGLAFMHGLDTPIVHRDIKASNVLLDNAFEPHIADFGLARTIEGSHSHVSTQVAGTMGYMPPEYRDGYTTAKVDSDVYSFGVLMFEVATGKRPNWPVMEDGHEIWMLKWAKNRILDNRHLEVFDPTIPRERLCSNEVVEFLRVADLCTSYKPKDRPPMSKVVEMLNHLPL